MLFMILGFALACYAVIGNDSIQTIGTFLASNKNKPWWVLWLFLGSIMTAVLVTGWVINGGDTSYGRLSKIPETTIHWWHIIPMIGLLLLTKIGIPVSTTFMALSVFSGSIVLQKIITKSLVGYGVAFLATFIIWLIIYKFEKHISKSGNKNPHHLWLGAQWASTGFLWSQWLMQDLANIYVFAPRVVPLWFLILSVIFLLALLAFLVKGQGGKIQEIVLVKTNTLDIRSATLINLFYALILFYFKNLNSLPMSTTWVFLGTIAGREMILSLMMKHKSRQLTLKDISSDVGKATFGLVISVSLALAVKYFFALV